MDETRGQTVRERAYAIWEREGRPEGRAEQHWRMAEQELGVRPLDEEAEAAAPLAETPERLPERDLTSMGTILP